MSASEWLDAHADGVPAALAARLRKSAAPFAGIGTQPGDAPDQLLHAGATALLGVLQAEPMTRAQALDLLNADALVTCAFEAAASEPERFGERADRAMRAIAELAAPGGRA